MASKKPTETSQPARKRAVKKARPKQGNSKKAAAHRRKVFVEAYIANGGNATDAAKTAGYSAKTAYSQGGRLLKNVEIAAEIAARSKQIAKKYELTTESIIAELAKIVHADLRKLVGANGEILPVKDWPDDLASAIAAIDVTEIGLDGNAIGQTKKIKLWDKNSAIEKAMKHLGMFEKDNAQKTDPLTELAKAIQGNSIGPVKGGNA